MSPSQTVKVDFHLHSRASNVTDYYAANSFSIPESYSEPLELHAELHRRGMTLVTLTDHNSIDGVKELLDRGLDDVFISAEMTTTFPEDGCNIHVTVANMTETQFAEVNRLRGNVYEMISYVDREIEQEASAPAGNRIAYFMTHPLMSTQNRPYGREGSLSLEHIEKVLLLINAFEVRNGTRTRALNEITHRLIAGLDPATIERLSNKHGIKPKGPQPWRKALLAGSDDHSGINPGRTWTQFNLHGSRRPVANDVVDAIREQRTRPEGQFGGPISLAHAMLKLLHDGQKSRTSGGVTLRAAGPVGTLLRMVFEPGSVSTGEKLRFRFETWLQRILPGTGRGGAFEQVLAAQIAALVGDSSFRRRLEACERTDDRIFLVVSALVNRLFGHYAQRLVSSDRGNVVCAIKEVVALVSSNLFVSLPYLVAYLHQSSDRFIVRDVRKAFELAERERLVLVTDTFFDVNGVSRTIRRMLDEAARRGIELTVVTCISQAEFELHGDSPEVRRLIDGGRLRIFISIVSGDMPQYAGLKLHVPPFLDLLKYLQEEGFTKMQISTPGPVGVAGLLAAKVLQIETSSTYHTSFPEYVENFTNDISLEALTWKYMILFYHSVDEVVVPSKFIARLLHERGLRNRALLVLDRWVDIERFQPRHRSETYWAERGIADAESRVKFAYVGRVSVEKNLAVLADAFRRLCGEREDVHLVVIGDGPYRAALAARLEGLPVTFTGMLEGLELSRAIASCDAKLFPSTTDTWGNAPLEAQACGLPVVVSDMGGPQELMLDGVTGFKVRGRDVEGLAGAMRRLCNPGLRLRMGLAARRYVEDNRIDEPFTAILDSAAYRARCRSARRDVEVESAVVEVISVPARTQPELPARLVEA
ncbi:MAG: glycosyltransferase [Planctomycetota bacterium]|nr:glycosyltransferase [Planctomycetota bacterium]